LREFDPEALAQVARANGLAVPELGNVPGPGRPVSGGGRPVPNGESSSPTFWTLRRSGATLDDPNAHRTMGDVIGLLTGTFQSDDEASSNGQAQARGEQGRLSQHRAALGSLPSPQRRAYLTELAQSDPQAYETLKAEALAAGAARAR
jgi:hypothetical protein